MNPSAAHRPTPGRAASGLALLLVALAACSGGAPSNVAAADAATGMAAPASSAASAGPGGSTAQALADAQAQLQSALDQAGQCEADAECRSVPVGGKACGGPTGYAAYSARQADPATINALARREHDLALQEARESHRVSNCLFLADPGARCQAHRCVTGGPGAGPSPQR